MAYPNGVIMQQQGYFLVYLGGVYKKYTWVGWCLLYSLTNVINDKSISHAYVYVLPSIQLSQSEDSREQLQQTLQAIEKSHQGQLPLDSLQDRLKYAEQEIARLKKISQEQVNM